MRHARQRLRSSVSVATAGRNKSSPQRAQQVSRCKGISFQHASQIGVSEIFGRGVQQREHNAGSKVQLSTSDSATAGLRSTGTTTRQIEAPDAEMLRGKSLC